ncbi:hypothetical protein ACXET9_07110 [Brachybacterium sp. DNPG3]
MNRRRSSVSLRPQKPSPLCESCGGDVWWAWGLSGKVWTPLAPERHPIDGNYGTYEVWPDQYGGLLARYLPPGTRGVQVGSWRGVHHNAACGHWRTQATTALVREALAAVPVMPDGELLALGARLREVQEGITREIRSRAMTRDNENEQE